MKILILLNEAAMAANLRSVLENSGCQTEILIDSQSGMEYARLQGYDLLMLEQTTSGPDALDIARQLREEECTAPIVLLTSHSAVEDRIEYLNAGVDYFLVKPFDVRELLAAVQALIRRQNKPMTQLYFGNTCLDLTTGVLSRDGESIRLSAREMDVARLLFRSGEHNLDKNVILARVWGYDSHAVENHVEVYVGFLRKKLRAIGSNIRIESVRRMGYHLELAPHLTNEAGT